MKRLKWQSVIVITVKPSFRPVEGVKVTRCHLAKSVDGVLMAQWETPESERDYPKAQLVGWKPSRTVPFRFPVQFERQDSPTLVTLIPRGALIVPYEERLFQQYEALSEQVKGVYDALNALYEAISASPMTVANIPFTINRKGDPQ